jgi:uncharacterized repeat protein (TIGR03806 family)
MRNQTGERLAGSSGFYVGSARARTSVPLAGLLLLAACGPPDPEQQRIDPAGCRLSGEAFLQPQLKLVPVLTGGPLASPIQVGPARDGTRRVFGVSQLGRIFVADDVTPGGAWRPWLDLTTGKGLESGGEKGLLGLAFAPDFAASGRFYVNYTRRQNGQLQSVISRFLVSPPLTGSPSPGSEQILLTVNQPYDNHNGGQLAFGPDGFLYIGLGDGGSGGDPQGNGQKLGTLLGKILRLDVGTPDASYRVPADNPFVGQTGRRGEIWAYGLRNPWRFSFDPRDGALWAADVGQNAVEEVDLIERGKNYGWNIMEGDRCFNPSSGCDRTGLVLPAFAYPQTEGKSVTGGFVYRGAAMPELVGTYIFGDYVSGTIWGLRRAFDGSYARTRLADSGKALSGFGLDADGEIYALDYRSGGVFRLERAAAVPTDAAMLPTRLSETGCFEDVAARKLAAGVVSYSVNAPLWSDGAAKERGLALPPGARGLYTETGAWSLPVGTALIKTFLLGERPVETRFLLRGSDRWRGVTYRWRADGSDADLLTDGLTEQIGSSTWAYPSREDCLVCHTDASGQVLGLQTAQLNRTHDVFRTGHPQNQIEALSRLGYIDGAPAAAAGLPRFPEPTDEAARLGVRARAYLHANCAHCHQPGGLAVGTLDLRFGVALVDTRGCNVAPSQGDLGVAGARILVPGAPDKSTLLLRMATTDSLLRMPRVATLLPDPQGVALVRAWIAGLPASCVDPDFP